VLTSLHLNKKSRGVCIKALSPPASLAFIGQVAKHTTVKWSIAVLVIKAPVATSRAYYLIFMVYLIGIGQQFIILFWLMTNFIFLNSIQL